MNATRQLSGESVHGTSVAIGGRAALITGPSGSGKSDLALRLIDRGFTLVSDDQTVVRRDGERLLASGPERIGDEWHRTGQKLQLTEGSIEAASADKSRTLYFEEGRTTRDYYVVEDDGGRRFWLFRLGLFGVAETPRWFLQGFFA